MNHYKSIYKFLSKIIYENKIEANEVSFNSGFLQNEIPEDLLTEEMKKTGETSLYIDGDTFHDFNLIIENLSKNMTTEHLHETTIKNMFWFLLCDVVVNINKLKKEGNALKEKINLFLYEISKPLKEYEIFFYIKNFNLNKYPFQIWDFTINKFDRDNLIKMGIDVSDPVQVKILDQFYNKPLMIFIEKGNNSHLVLERARKKASFNLKILQTYLIASNIVQDTKLLFDISEYALIRLKNSCKYSWDWRGQRKPIKSSFDKKFDKLLNKPNIDYEIIKNFTSELQSHIQRAFFWIGKSVVLEDIDDKIISLCTAMETLLTSRDEKNKGETLAYRMILLNSILNKSFIDPFKILWIYNLRSKIIHGSSLFITNKIDYFTMRRAALETLFNFIILIDKNKIKKFSKMIKFLESSDQVQPTIDWLKSYNSDSSLGIVNALKTSIEANY